MNNMSDVDRIAITATASINSSALTPLDPLFPRVRNGLCINVGFSH